MSVLAVKSGIMNKCAAEELNIAKKLAVISEEIMSVKNGLSYSVRSRARIDSQLSALSKYCKKQSDNTTSLNRVLSNAVSAYLSTENKVGNINVGTAAKRVSGGTSSAAKKSTKKKSYNWKELIKNAGKIIGNFGTIGSVFGAASKFASAENSIDFGQGLMDIIGKGAKIAGKMIDKSYIDLFGSTSKSGIGFMENLAIQLDDFKINNSYNSVNLSSAAKSANNIGAIAKWGGVALTGISKFIGNYEEFDGNLKSGRFWAETAGETAVSVGTGILATAAVATILPATAPAWVVGAVGTGVVLVGKKVIECIPGVDDAADFLSDKVLDFAEGAADAAKKGVKAIGDGIKGAGKTIAKWFKW